jgi:Macrocin-O-methyltransferase (TylF)
MEYFDSGRGDLDRREQSGSSDLHFRVGRDQAIGDVVELDLGSTNRSLLALARDLALVFLHDDVALETNLHRRVVIIAERFAIGGFAGFIDFRLRTTGYFRLLGFDADCPVFERFADDHDAALAKVSRDSIGPSPRRPQVEPSFVSWKDCDRVVVPIDAGLADIIRGVWKASLRDLRRRDEAEREDGFSYHFLHQQDLIGNRGANPWKLRSLKAHGITDRVVWVVDSFAGLPPFSEGGSAQRVRTA